MAFWNKKPPAPQPTKPERKEPKFSRVHKPTRGDREKAIAKLQFVPVALPTRADGTVATQDWSTPISGGGMMFGQTIPDSMLDWYGNQSFIGFQACMIMAQHWLVNAACEIPIIDALRKGHEFVSADGEKIDIKILAQHKKFSKKLKLNQKITWFGKKARVFGIAIAIFKVASDDPLYYENPFNPDGITKGSYTGIALPDPYYCTPQMSMDGYDPASTDFYEPEYWIVSGKKYHKSHLIIFRHSGDLPSQLRPAYQWAGVSLVQQIYEAVYSALQASNESNRLLMTKRLTVRQGDIGAALLDQVDFEDKMLWAQSVRDNYGEQIIDVGESLTQLETALAEVTNVIGQKFELVSAIARMPSNKLMQTALQGFGSIGEAEEAIYNGMLETIQEQCLTEFLERHYELSIRSMGNAPFEFEIRWPAIDTIGEKEQAEINQLKATTDQANLQSGAITGEDINKRLSADPNSGYDGIKYVEPEVDYSGDDDPRDGMTTTEDATPIPAGASWITLEDGQHVLIGKDGKVIGGAGGALDGKYYGSHGENSPNKTITKNYNEEMAAKNKPIDPRKNPKIAHKYQIGRSKYNTATMNYRGEIDGENIYEMKYSTNGMEQYYVGTPKDLKNFIAQTEFAMGNALSDMDMPGYKGKTFNDINGIKHLGGEDIFNDNPSKPQDNVAQSLESSKMDSRSNEAGKPGETTMKAKEHKWNGTDLEITINEGPGKGVYKISPYKVKDGIIDLGPRTLLDNRTVNLKMKASDFPGIEKEAAEKIIELKEADEKDFNSEKRRAQRELDANMAKNGFYHDDYHGSMGIENELESRSKEAGKPGAANMKPLTRKNINIGFAKQSVIDLDNEPELRTLNHEGIDNLAKAKEYNAAIMARGANSTDQIDINQPLNKGQSQQGHKIPDLKPGETAIKLTQSEAITELSRLKGLSDGKEYAMTLSPYEKGSKKWTVKEKTTEQKKVSSPETEIEKEEQRKLAARLGVKL